MGFTLEFGFLSKVGFYSGVLVSLFLGIVILGSILFFREVSLPFLKSSVIVIITVGVGRFFRWWLE